ncbi:MAG: MFS transporter, partial [Anaerolineales bacterium]
MALHIPPSLKHRKFLLLWTGLIISTAGSQMQVSAISWHIRELSGKPDPLALGGIGLARILPIILFSLLSGPVADTYNRKTVLLITQSLQALTAVFLAWLTFSNQISIALIYLLTAIQAGAMAFDAPARQAMIPNLVPEQELPNAFSLINIAKNSASIIGPLLGGVVIATMGQGYTYFINAISFLAVIFALLIMGTIPQDLKHSSGINLGAVKEGIQFIMSRPIILSTMLIDFVATFFASASTMLPIVARDILHVGEVGYGLLAAGESIGSLTAGLVISQMNNIKKQGKVFLTAVILFGLATILFG